MTKLNKFMQLTKVDVAKKLIYGTFTAEVVDKSGEVADYETTKTAIQAWSGEIKQVSGGKSLGNIRKMHGKEVVGKAIDIIYDDAGKAIHGCVEANDQTIDEAAKGVLNGFSIGGAYAKKWADPVHKGATRFTPVIMEISVVDNPCVPDAVFNAIKDASFAVVNADGSEEMRKFAPKELEKEQLELEIPQKFIAKDGSQHDTKDGALQKNAELAAAESAADVLALLKDDAETKEEPKADAKEEPKKKKASIKLKAKKTAEGGELAKGLDQVARLACIIQDLDWLCDSMEWEQEYEGDNSKNPKYIKQCINDLVEILKDVVVEETDEMASAKADGLTEVGVDALRKVTGNAELLKEWVAPVVPTEELKKVTLERDALKGVIADITTKVEKKFAALESKIKHLEDQPAPDKVVLTTVYKGGGEDNTKPEKQPIGGGLTGSASPADRREMI